jgi:hypothetical protein
MPWPSERTILRAMIVESWLPQKLRQLLDVRSRRAVATNEHNLIVKMGGPDLACGTGNGRARSGA